MIAMLMRILFYCREAPVFTAAERRDFDRMYAQAVLGDEGEIIYDAEHPKYRFIDYLIQQKNLVAHGSNQREVKRFEPRKQTLFNGRPVEAVFASKDGIWPIFYAVFDRSKLAWNFRNGCFRTRHGGRYYFFSLDRPTMDRDPWTSGMVYLLPAETFQQAHQAAVYFDEWISESAAAPCLKLEVSREDFPYWNRTATHRTGESIVATWLLYKLRTRRNAGKGAGLGAGPGDR